jgi:hypothetical protein
MGIPSNIWKIDLYERTNATTAKCKLCESVINTTGYKFLNNGMNIDRTSNILNKI